MGSVRLPGRLSELAIDLYTPLCTSLCFCTIFSAMVFTVRSCTFSVYICLLFLCLTFSLQGGPAGGGSGRSCRSLHRLMLISTCLIALDCRFTLGLLRTPGASLRAS